MTIVEFLTARLDEDQEMAEGMQFAGLAGIPSPRKVLLDIWAKRAIIHQHGNGDGGHECPDGFMDGAETEPHTGYEVVCMTQRFLASVYSDHSDYQQEWKP